MKYTFFLAALLGSFISNVRAQDFTASSSSDNWRDVLTGPYFTGGGAVNAGTVPTGSKTNYKFAWGLGVASEVPMAKNISVEGEIGYDARSISFFKQDDENFKFDYTFNYFAVRPSIMLSDFKLGVGIGVPLGYSITTQLGANQPSATTSGGASGMTLLFELRLGAIIPIIQSDNGRLNLVIDASYALSNIVTNGPLEYISPSANPTSTDNNGPLATAQLGLQYLFDVSPH